MLLSLFPLLTVLGQALLLLFNHLLLALLGETLCLLPVLIYLGFLLSYLLIDLLRAILSIPGKLDALRKS